jgi:hypothetical protein
MKRRIILLSLLALSLFIFETEAASLRLLSENPTLYDGQEVEIIGEVLDELPQIDGCWFNLSDETASIGVWADKGVKLPQIMHFGSYMVKGDILRVRGTFQASCYKHLGQMDIHADQIVVIGRGLARKEEVPQQKKSLAFGWLVFFLITFIIYLVKRLIKKSRKLKERHISHA